MRCAVVLLAALLWTSLAAAQGVPISALPSASTPLAGSEVVPLVQSGVTKQTTSAAIANLAVRSITPGTGLTGGGGPGTVTVGLDTARVFTSGASGLTPASGGGTTNFLRADGVFAAPAGASGANPTATAGPAAVNGAASTFMRSDAAPAVQKASSSQFGIVEVDNTTITSSAGVISAAVRSAANPTATASDTAVNGVAITYMRSDAAPAVQKTSSSVFGVAKVDGTSITAVGGVISATGASGANPTATAGPTTVNGVATTFMRSDGAPAVQLGTSAQKGIVQCDNVTITCTSGVIATSSTVATLNGTSQALTGGWAPTSVNLGTYSSGSHAIVCGNGPQQYFTNGGASTIAAPAADSNCLVMMTNNGSAGAITFSGFTVGSSTGDALDTVNGHIFTMAIWRINGVSGYRVAASQ